MLGTFVIIMTNTLILCRKSPVLPNGGRPMKLGSLLFDNSGKRGLFIGYDDQGRKIAINDHDLMDLFKFNHLRYTVEVNIKPKSNPISFARFIAKYFIPDSVREQLAIDQP